MKVKSFFYSCSLVFFITFSVFSQEYNYVIYDIAVDMEKLSSTVDKKEIEPAAYNLFMKMINDVNESQYTLLFDDVTSVFKPVEKLSIDDDYLNMASGILYSMDIEDSMFYDTTCSEFYIKRGKDALEHVVKVDPISIEWTISNDSRVVDGLVYKKANTKMLIASVPYDIEVWFCPSIPKQLGPGYFRGLPGLITEVYASTSTTGLDYSLVLNEVGYNDKKDKIKIPLSDYKIYSETESQALFSGALQKFKN